MKKTFLLVASFTFILFVGTAAPFNVTFTDGIQLTEQTAAAGSHKERPNKDKRAKGQNQGKPGAKPAKGKGMGKGKGAEMREKRKSKAKSK